jgi:hypothetical protein
MPLLLRVLKTRLQEKKHLFTTIDFSLISYLGHEALAKLSSVVPHKKGFE